MATHKGYLLWMLLIELAAEGGHLKIFEWAADLEDFKGAREKEIFIAAIKGGNLKLVEYLLDETCPFKALNLNLTEALYEAIETGNLPMLKLLDANMDDSFKENTDFCAHAAAYGEFDMGKTLLYLREKGCFNLNKN